MTDLNTCTAGIDVSKSKLDVAVHPTGASRRVDFTAEGLAELDRFLAEHKAERVGFEATGGHEWRLLPHLRRGAIPAARFQPVQVKAFARSRLQRAKNDRLDAFPIAAFTASLPLLPSLPDPALDGLSGRLTYIEQIEERAAALAGVAPFDNDSGTRAGKRSIGGGRQRLRESLFMAAFRATRWNPQLASFHARLRAHGKCHLAAVIAVARKLVILANAIAARGTPWRERPVMP